MFRKKSNSPDPKELIIPLSEDFKLSELLRRSQPLTDEEIELIANRFVKLQAMNFSQFLEQVRTGRIIVRMPEADRKYIAELGNLEVSCTSADDLVDPRD